MADTEVPADITLPVAGNSNKALADLIFKSRLLLWWPVLSATKLKYKRKMIYKKKVLDAIKRLNGTSIKKIKK